MKKQSKNEYYEKNRERILKYQNEKYLELSSVMKQWKKTLSCKVCGENDDSCLDFHHVDEKEKEKNIVGMVARGKKSVVKELKKCVVVCANCHRKIHAGKIVVEVDEKLSENFDVFA